MNAGAGEIFKAATREGDMLPVIDVTHPAFAMPAGEAGLEVLRQDYAAEEQRNGRRNPFLRGLLLRFYYARRSKLLRALVAPKAAYLDGLTTYVMKLGAENLVPPFDRPLDRRVAQAAMVRSVRLRLQQTAHLLAEGVRSELASSAAPLHVIDIGGGPAIGSINALIILKKSDPARLARPVTIHVLDLDEDGPIFGRNALAALTAPEGRSPGSRPNSSIFPMTGRIRHRCAS